jgi:two-component system, sensor histidine kinase and response regulator
MAAVNLIGSYNFALVALSVLIAMFASYAALDLAGRVTAAGGWTRAVWLLCGAGAMGTGIWSMHYIGMLAFILPIPVAYHWPTVLLSLLAAILASVIALYVVSRKKMGASRAVAGSALMGAGIASMHYIGMAAMRLPATCRFNSFLVVLSVVFAVLISLAALWITFHFRDQKMGIGREKLAGAVVMGAAIPVMHYTGMAAASFTPSGMPADLSHAVSISTLGTAGIAAVTFVVLGLALLTSWVDRRFAAQTLELQEEKLQRSEAYLAEAQNVKDATRAADIISRIRLLFKKVSPQRELVDVNEVIREMTILLRNEASRYSISVRTELETDFPLVMGDRVQLQQVFMNLILNAIDAVKDVDGTRELAIKSQREENDQLLVSVSDTGVGLPPQQADQIFNAFFTTKPHGTGMGLRISRSIVESHGGRLWAADNSPRGASFHLTLPTNEAHE